jgi:hypothetical protein
MMEPKMAVQAACAFTFTTTTSPCTFVQVGHSYKANSYFILQVSSSPNVKVSTNYFYEMLILFLQVPQTKERVSTGQMHTDQRVWCSSRDSTTTTSSSTCNSTGGSSGRAAGAAAGVGAGGPVGAVGTAGVAETAGVLMPMPIPTAAVAMAAVGVKHLLPSSPHRHFLKFYSIFKYPNEK